MPYMIDGHNLIAALPGLSLSDTDDERQLVDQLNAYFTRIRRKATVFFDRARVGNRDLKAGHFLRAVFIRAPRTADDAIRSELRKLGRSASNWTVISSDREVMESARVAGARVMDSQAFADLLTSLGSTGETSKSDTSLSAADIDLWLRLFQGDKD
jgi:predicted RNA-binding protein with PIN domain